MKRAWTTLRLIVAVSAVATSATLPARGDYLTFDIASHEAMADYTRFESRSWAADAVGEGGRLERNTVWSGDEHVIVSDIYIPSGVTLTINAGTVVKFREGTRIKVEDGGSLVINGASGNEVVLEGYDDETVFTGIVLQSSAASYSDNTFVIVRGFNFGRYATVSLNNTTAFLGGGQALVPVDVSGSRDTAFSFDWVAETNGVTFASGTMNWNRVSDGRKNITVPYPDGLPGCSNFVIRAVTFRCCSPNVRECVVTLSEFITTDIFSHEAMADYIAFESREWAAGMEGEGGRLATNATWSGTHKIVSDVYIPSGVTLTLTADTVVEFCEGTRIKIEDGGKLNIVGADGHDVILRGAEGVANFGGIVKMPNGTFTDNSYFRLEGFTYGALANVALHDSSTFRSSGLALIPVTVSGSRSTAFSIDWVAETNGAPYKTGTLKWNSVSDGTKNISINYGAELDGYTNFTLRAAVDRACKTSPNICSIKISDFIVSDIASHESMADSIRFESRDWAADLEGEGGRLAANATWEGTHKIASDVYIPSGVTLTLAADAVVEFYEGTRIKIEDGGTLNIVGANGHDVIIRGAEGVTNYVGVVKMPNGTYTDNMYVQYTDRPYSAYPYITVHETTTYREAGKMWIAFSVSGTTRNQSFNVDWSTDKGDSGTLTWSSSSDGTKWIEIPIAAEPVGGTTNHVINVTAARGCNISVGTSVLTVLEPDYNAKGQVTLTEGDAQSNDFAVNGGIKTQPLFLSDVEKVQYSGKWQPYDENEAAVLRVTLETDNGATVLKEVSPSETGAFDLDLKQYPVGYYTLKHEILNDLGETLATMQKTFSIADDEDVVLHGGVLASNEVWAADKVHVVYETVVVPSIYTIFIEPGAIVKFMTGTGIDISQGGAFFANRIVFTHINDDTVGGDTLNDGFTVAPPMDAYYLAGAFTFGDDTELRGITQNNALTGTISTQKMLSRGSTYRVSGTLTIANGGSLTIPPGTVLKMESGARVVVNSGATLNAIGTRAAPIVITSIKDDTISGDTNGDGDKTMPQPGDWRQIQVAGGMLNAAHLSMFYLSNDNNQGGLYVTGGEVSLDCCTIAHCNYDCMRATGGKGTVRNSVFADASIGVAPNGGAIEYVNCVFNGLTTAVRWPTGSFVNCVFSEVATTFFDSTGSTPIKNCVLWNPAGYGPQNVNGVVGANGNIWADPLFVDSEKGDFRIVEGSPCVDAADGAVAPELDYFGQPRITLGGSPSSATETNEVELVGQLADIGICEVMPRDVVSDIDLVPQSVRTTTNAVPGQLLFVKWEIANVGGREVEAAWRDTVSLVSESGREVVLGVKTTSSRIGVGGSVFCSAYFTVPAIAEGTWYPKVNVNSYHDIFEGSLAANNALTGERAVSVGLEALDPSISREGVINGGTPTVLKLAFGENDDNRMVKFNVPAGVKATWGFGFIPGGSRSVATASGSMTASGDGVMFRAPDGATDVYVVLESDTTTTYNLSTESTQMTITGVTPATLPSSGTTTLTITGAGFGETNALSLISSVGRVALNAPQKDASGNLIATVDCATLTAGQTYALCVESGENAAELPGAVAVTKVEGVWDIRLNLIIPPQVRQGRESCGYVEYSNVGNITKEAFIISIKGSHGTFFSDINSKMHSRGMLLLLSESILPGETKRIAFRFKNMSSISGRITCGVVREAELIDAKSVERIRFCVPNGEKYEQAVSELCEGTWGDLLTRLSTFLKVNNLSGMRDNSLLEIFRMYIRDKTENVVFRRLIDEEGNAIAFANVFSMSKTDDFYIRKSSSLTDRNGFCIIEVDESCECDESSESFVVPGYGLLASVSEASRNGLLETDLVVRKAGRLFVKTNTDKNNECLIVFENRERKWVETIRTKGSGVTEVHDLFPGKWFVSAFDVDGVQVSDVVQVELGYSDTNMTLEMKEVLEIGARIVDVDGNALAGAAVKFSSCAGERSTTSDAQGRCSVTIHDIFPVRISVRKSGYVDSTVFLTNAESVVDVKMSEGVVVNGQLDNAPSTYLDSIIKFKSQTATYYVVTDSAGQYSTTLPSGNYVVCSVGKPGYEWQISLRDSPNSIINTQAGRLLGASDDPSVVEVLSLPAHEAIMDAIAVSMGTFYGGMGFYQPGAWLLKYIGMPGYNWNTPGTSVAEPDSNLSRRAMEDNSFTTPYNKVKENVYSDICKHFQSGNRGKQSHRLGRPWFEFLPNSRWYSPLWASFRGTQGLRYEVLSASALNDNDESAEYICYNVEVLIVGEDKYEFDTPPGREADDLSATCQLLEKYGWAKRFNTELHIRDNFVVEVERDRDPDPPDDDGDNEDFTVPQSCDPNEMRGKLGLGDPETQRFVKPGEELTYTIYFENKTNATAAAQEVFVTNPLSEWLDWSTFKMHEVAFGDQIDLGLVDKGSGTSEVTMKGTNFVVRTELVLEENGDAGTRDACPYQARWYMRIVDPTTDTGWPTDIVAGFLPPNDETHRGEGHITYSICVREDAPANLVIPNSADIVFDHNPAIKTDPAWWNTVAPTTGNAKFNEAVVETEEGSNAVIRVTGGNAYSASSVKVYLTYNTAAAADIDLKTAAWGHAALPSDDTVGRDDPIAPQQTNLKFPLTLSWEKGEVGEKVITIPVKTDKTVEGDEFFTLQLAEAEGMELGAERVCTVTIRDMNDKTLKTTVTPYKPKKDETVATNSVTVASGNAKGGFVSGTGEYTAGSKLTLTAEARPGWAFQGWRLSSTGGSPVLDGEILSNKTKWQIVVTNDEEYVAVFEKIPYVRGLADPADAGKVAGSGLCAAGKKVTLKAAANKNYTFLGWVRGGRGTTALPEDGDGRAGSPLPAADGEFVATTPSLVIDRSAKPGANSKTSTTITNVAEDVTYYAVFKSDPEIFVTVDATDGAGAEPTGKGAGKYVAGTITGEGKYAPGKKVTLKATANKGYVFAGWACGGRGATALPGDVVSQAASLSFEMPSNDVEYVAMFVTADEDKGSIALAVNGEEMRLAGDGSPHQTNLWCGVYLEWPVAASALSETKVKVAGLPSGLKFTDKPVTSKIGSGKTAVVVTNVPANTIYGAPTAASKTKVDKNTGAVTVTPSAVKVTVTTAGKSSQTYQIDTVVDPLPAWAVGTFDGHAGRVTLPDGEEDGDGRASSPLPAASGTVSLTIAANGKVSGKAQGDGLTYTLAAPYYSGFTASDDGEGLTSNFLADVTASWSYKAGSKTIKTNDVVQMTVQDNGIGGIATGGPSSVSAAEAGDDGGQGLAALPEWIAWQNLWKRADTKTEQPVFKKNIDVTCFLGEEGDAANTIKLTFKRDGVVSFAGKVGGAKVSGSSQLVWVESGHAGRETLPDGWVVTLYAPAKGAFAGWCKTFAVDLAVGDANVVTDVEVVAATN